MTASFRAIRASIAVAAAACAILLTGTNAHAQLGFKIGAVAGEDFAGSQTLPSPFPNSSAEGASGYILGVAFDKDLFGPFSIQTELLVTQRSFTDAATIPNGEPNAGNAESWVQKLNYLQIPILLKLSPLDGTVQPYIFAGPNIGFKLSASTITDSTGTSQSADESTLFKNIDLGLDAGGGVSVKVLPIMWLFADVRYTVGLVDAYNNVTGAQSGLRARDVKWTGGVMLGF